MTVPALEIRALEMARRSRVRTMGDFYRFLRLLRFAPLRAPYLVLARICLLRGYRIPCVGYGEGNEPHLTRIIHEIDGISLLDAESS